MDETTWNLVPWSSWWLELIWTPEIVSLEVCSYCLCRKLQNFSHSTYLLAPLCVRKDDDRPMQTSVFSTHETSWTSECVRFLLINHKLRSKNISDAIQSFTGPILSLLLTLQMSSAPHHPAFPTRLQPVDFTRLIKVEQLVLHSVPSRFKELWGCCEIPYTHGV